MDQEWSQCIQTLYSHTETVTSIACSPVDNLIASASRDRTIKIWEEETGQMLQSLVGHTSEIESVTFSPTGKRIASCSIEDGLRVWDVRTGECLTILQHDFICDVVFSPTGQIASVSTEGILKIWTPHNEDYVNTITIEQARAPVAFLSANQVAALSADEFAPSSNPRNIGSGTHLMVNTSGLWRSVNSVNRNGCDLPFLLMGSLCQARVLLSRYGAWTVTASKQSIWMRRCVITFLQRDRGGGFSHQ